MQTNKKKIEAHIRPFRSEAVRQALLDQGVESVSVMESQQTGQETHQELYRGTEYSVNYTPFSVLQCIVEEDNVDDVVRAIQDHGATENDHDGKIIITPVEQIVPVSDEESAAG